MINATPNPTDARAISTLCAYWVHRAAGHVNHDLELDPSVAVREMAELPINNAGNGFDYGFAAAIEIVAAVLADPFGNPAPAIRSICEKVRIDVIDLRRSA